MSPIFALLLTALSTSVNLQSAPTSQVGKPVPNFSLAADGGQRIFAKDLAGQGAPYFLFFINADDNVSRQSASYINRIVKSYTPSKVKWFGVINANDSRLRGYQAEFNPPYQLFSDVGLTTTQQFRVQSSPSVIEVGEDGIVKAEWFGLSGEKLKHLNRAVGRANKKRTASVDFSHTPSTLQFGTPYVKVDATGG